MMAHDTDTIFALSSGPPPSGVAVLRISGPQVRFGLGTIIPELPLPNRHRLTKLRMPDGTVLDQAVVLYFQGPHSFTGEDLVEIQCHGSLAVISALESVLEKTPGFRAAEAGEFSKRAFLNGKMDLTQTEGLADLIAAETEMQRQQALRQADGALGRLYAEWRADLIACRAAIEADLDFSDEEDVPGSVLDDIDHRLHSLMSQIGAHLLDSRRGERLRSGIEIVLAGPPNAGKSSLLNRLAQRDAAIVTPIAGTTRDIVSVQMDLEGFPVILTDTAGLREEAATVEAEGIRRARARQQTADLVLWLVDLTDSDAQQAPLTAFSGSCWQIGTKRDLAPATASDLDFILSVVTGDGVDELVSALGQFVRRRYGLSDQPMLTNNRQRGHVERCYQALQDAINAGPIELKAEQLRRAADHLGRCAGAIDAEDVLDQIFSRFCIGK